MNQSPPRQRTVRTEPPALIRRQTQRRNLVAAAPMHRRAIIHPPILRAHAFTINNSNKATIANVNTNRLANFNSNSNSNSNNMRMPAIKRRKLNKNGNKNTRKTQRINVYKLAKYNNVPT
jgi:hypothetical protein